MMTILAKLGVPEFLEKQCSRYNKRAMAYRITILCDNTVGALSGTLGEHGFAASARLLQEFPGQFHPAHVGFTIEV